ALLLLLLVSNLLLWEKVASVPLSSDEIDDDQLYLKKLFDHAMILSQNISKLNIEMRRTYLEDFPKLILSRLRAWNDTLKNLLTILGNRTHNDVISLAKDIERKYAELSEDIKSILS
ncbi:hypothetical protein A6R68_07587, partial [Neotoma lepida]